MQDSEAWSSELTLKICGFFYQYNKYSLALTQLNRPKYLKNCHFLFNSADYLIFFLFQLSEEANVWSEK